MQLKLCNIAKIKDAKIEFDGIEDLPILPVNIDGTLCVMPTEEYEGFFIAKLRKLN